MEPSQNLCYARKRASFLSVGAVCTVHLTALPADMVSYNPCLWVLVPCYRKMMLALRGALGVPCLQPSCAVERPRGSYYFSCLSEADWKNLFPFIAWVAAEPAQIDSAEVVSRPCLVLFMILSVVLLIISVLFLLLIISCLYLYRRKTVSFPYVFRMPRTHSLGHLWMLP